MITNAMQLKEAIRAMQAQIDGHANAGPILVQTAKDMYESDDLEIDDSAGKSSADDGNWVQAWVWVPHTCD